MKNKNQTVFYNILSTIILQGVAFFTTPLFSRLLGTENYGIVSVYTAWVQVISITFGLQTMVTIPIAQNEYSTEKQETYQSSVLLMSVVSFMTLGGIALLLPESLWMQVKLSRFMLLLIILQAFGTFCVNFLNMKQIYEWNAGRNFALAMTTTFSTVILAFILVHRMSSKDNYWGYLIGYAVPYFVLAVLICIYILRNGKRGEWFKYWKFCIVISFPVILHGLSNILLSQSDRIMLQQLLDNSITGVYSLALTFGSVLAAIYSALNNSWVPFFYQYMGEERYDRLKHHEKNYLELFTVLTIGFMLLSTEVYQIFAGREYWDGIRYLPIIAMSNYFTFLYSFPVNYEFCKKRTSIVAIGTVLSACCNIFLNLILIRHVGAIGAAIATLVSHILLFVFHHLLSFYVINKGDYPFRFREFLPYLLSVLCAVTVVYVIADYSILRFMIAMILGLMELGRIIQRKSIF